MSSPSQGLTHSEGPLLKDRQHKIAENFISLEFFSRLCLMTKALLLFNNRRGV